MTSSQTKYLALLPILLICLLIGVSPARFCIIIVLIDIIGIFYFISRRQIDYSFFLVTLAAAFWGPYLAIASVPSLFLFRLLLPIHLGLFLLNYRKKAINNEFKYIVLGLAIWILFSAVTILWSDYPTVSLGSLYFEFEIAYFILFSVYYFDSLVRIKKAAIVLSINYCVIMLYSLIGEYFLEIHLKFSTAYTSGYDTRPTGMFVNTNDFAAFISMFFLIFLLSLNRKKLWQRIFAVISTTVLLLIDLLLIIQTNSRSGFIAFIFILLLLFVKYSKTQNVIFMMMIAVVGMFFRPNNSKIVDISTLITRVEMTFLGKMDSTAERMRIYKYALHSIAHHPFGVGVGSSQKHVFYLLNGYMNLPPGNNQSMGMHNFLLAILFDTGFIGLAGFVIILIYMCYRASKLFLSTSSYVFSYPLLTLIGFFAASVGSSSIFEMRTVWIAFGLAVAIVINREQILKGGQYV
ncbi:O-antigen ligase family protein [Lactobacillus sp. YT155]|uniref:O-antigen ligase family protein n=1 Tax=Lactobacillus sp. YT155 TaxID=3060955 RepID=UPI00265DAC2D|nr:O-antigen ligase family protein [Lactobacillus sp. YT155]MDO1604832.1 O-antigen ligase family protein [Lactobacillus sp. YT155]